MELKAILLKELANEAATTRKMLSRLPEDKYDWKPHEKSMSIRQLAGHIAEVPGWVAVGLATSELDFAKGDYQPTKINNNAELLACFEKNYSEGFQALENATEDDLWPTWTMRNGEQILKTYAKHEVIRESLNQTTHHRAQLGVYLRLLDIPVPPSYGPTADETSY